jgi:hypothetical protein
MAKRQYSASAALAVCSSSGRLLSFFQRQGAASKKVTLTTLVDKGEQSDKVKL